MNLNPPYPLLTHFSCNIRSLTLTFISSDSLTHTHYFNCLFFSPDFNCPILTVRFNSRKVRFFRCFRFQLMLLIFFLPKPVKSYVFIDQKAAIYCFFPCNIRSLTFISSDSLTHTHYDSSSIFMGQPIAHQLRWHFILQVPQVQAVGTRGHFS